MPPPLTRQPGEPRPPVQPWNVRWVPFATSPFHVPDEIEPGSVFHVMEVAVTVTVPEEPVFSVPATPAEAEGENVAQARTAKLKPRNFSKYCLFIVFLRKV